jgi:hypothetical protein
VNEDVVLLSEKERKAKQKKKMFWALKSSVCGCGDVGGLGCEFL